MKILVFSLDRADHATANKNKHVILCSEDAGVKAGLLPFLFNYHCCSITQHLCYTLEDFS